MLEILPAFVPSYRPFWLEFVESWNLIEKPLTLACPHKEPSQEPQTLSPVRPKHLNLQPPRLGPVFLGELVFQVIPIEGSWPHALWKDVGTCVGTG